MFDRPGDGYNRTDEERDERMGTYASSSIAVEVPADRLRELIGQLAGPCLKPADGNSDAFRAFDALTCAMGHEEEISEGEVEQLDGAYRLRISGYGKFGGWGDYVLQAFARNGATGKIDVADDDGNLFRIRFHGGRVLWLDAAVTYPEDPVDPS